MVIFYEESPEPFISPALDHLRSTVPHCGTSSNRESKLTSGFHPSEPTGDAAQEKVDIATSSEIWDQGTFLDPTQRNSVDLRLIPCVSCSTLGAQDLYGSIV